MSQRINYIENEIIDQYLHDENKTRPWIVGFSGGKDSTVVLQLIWNALLKIDRNDRFKGEKNGLKSDIETRVYLKVA